MTTPTRQVPQAKDASPTRARWSRPQITCLETRPEITAYAGSGDQWINNR